MAIYLNMQSALSWLFDRPLDCSGSIQMKAFINHDASRNYNRTSSKDMKRKIGGNF